MKPDFWHERWRTNEIGFHLSQANPLLVKYFHTLNLPQGSRIFLPLCGKSNDIPWLLSKGYQVVGVELSDTAIMQLFEALGIQPAVTKTDALKLYRAKGLDIFVDDIFELSCKALGTVDAIFDRGALVALPPEMRCRYTAQLMELSNKRPQLLITYNYNQRLMEGPPFAISTEELNQHYTDSYQLTLLEEVKATGGLRGLGRARELVWRLNPT